MEVLSSFSRHLITLTDRSLSWKIEISSITLSDNLGQIISVTIINMINCHRHKMIIMITMIYMFTLITIITMIIKITMVMIICSRHIMSICRQIISVNMMIMIILGIFIGSKWLSWLLGSSWSSRKCSLDMPWSSW